ncbi:hypothetical protein BGZ76_004692 [Entomortierella beljakovae]|nr:hypothetical protein BGZ76_004692 [Entomortierella beljakovae]
MATSNSKGKKTKNNRAPTPPIEPQLTPTSINIPSTSMSSSAPSSQPIETAPVNPEVTDSVAVSPSLSEASFFEIPPNVFDGALCASDASTVADTQESKGHGYDSSNLYITSAVGTSAPAKVSSGKLPLNANAEVIPGKPGYFPRLTSVTADSAKDLLKEAETRAGVLHQLLMVSYTDWLKSQMTLVDSRRDYSTDCDKLLDEEPDENKRRKEMARYKRRLNDQEDLSREANRVLDASTSQYTREYKLFKNVNHKLESVASGGIGDTEIYRI